MSCESSDACLVQYHLGDPQVNASLDITSGMNATILGDAPEHPPAVLEPDDDNREINELVAKATREHGRTLSEIQSIALGAVPISRCIDCPLNFPKPPRQ